MSPAVEQNVPQQQPPQDLAWTTTAMERWGQKLVSWGKKHPGKLYSVVYETDAQYVGWCLSRINSLEAPISDFARYTAKPVNRWRSSFAEAKVLHELGSFRIRSNDLC